MNKYESGYALISIFKMFGWILIVASVLIGFVIYRSAPPKMEYVSLIFFLAGAFQGIILLGVGAIGEAILDSAIHHRSNVSVQGDVLKVLNSIDGHLKRIETWDERKLLSYTSPSGSDTELGMLDDKDNELRLDDDRFAFHTAHFGYIIRQHPRGYVVGRAIFSSVAEAQKRIEFVVRGKAVPHFIKG